MLSSLFALNMSVQWRNKRIRMEWKIGIFHRWQRWTHLYCTHSFCLKYSVDVFDFNAFKFNWKKTIETEIQLKTIFIDKFENTVLYQMFTLKNGYETVNQFSHNDEDFLCHYLCSTQWSKRLMWLFAFYAPKWIFNQTNNKTDLFTFSFPMWEWRFVRINAFKCVFI